MFQIGRFFFSVLNENMIFFKIAIFKYMKKYIILINDYFNMRINYDY